MGIYHDNNATAQWPSGTFNIKPTSQKQATVRIITVGPILCQNGLQKKKEKKKTLLASLKIMYFLYELLHANPLVYYRLDTFLFLP
jgi:hypothetical protein